MEKIKLGDLCKPSAGQIKEDEDTLIDYIDISSVDNETKKVTGYQTITFGEAPSRARKAVRRGNVLVSTVRPNLNAVALLEEDTPNVSVASTGFCVLESKDDVDPRFILNFCKSKPFIDDMVSQATGASYPAVSDKIVRSALVPKYSYQEQQHISTVLDKLAGIIDDRRIELQQLDDLIKARFVELFGDPMINPKGFPVKTIEEVAVLNKGITYSPEDVADEGMIVLRSSNIKGNIFDLNDLVKITKKISPDKYVKENDILMCNRNGSARLVGKVAMIPKLDENMTFGTFMTIVRSDIYDYLFAFFQMDAFREQIKFQTAVAINQISLPLLASVKVPIPPINLIDEFVAFTKQVDKSKVVIQKALEETQILFDSLMHKYFG